MIGEGDEAKDGKDNGQDQVIVTERSDCVCVDSGGWLFLDNSCISGLEKFGRKQLYSYYIQ